MFVHWLFTVAAFLALAGTSALLGAPALVSWSLGAAGAIAAYRLGYAGIVRPMQELQALVKAHQDQASLLQSLINNAPMVIAIKDQDGRYLTVNSEFERLHGLTAPTLQGKQDRDFMAPETAETVRANDQRVLQFGETLRYQLPLQSASGLRQMESLKFPLYDTHQQIVGVGLVATDVTERELSREKFACVFHSSPDWVVITRLADGVVIDANEGFERIGGYSRADAIGHPIGNLNIWVNPAERAVIVETLLRDGHAVACAAKIRRKDGEVRDFVANASIVSLEGKTDSHAVWIAHDVTEELALHEKFVASFRLTPDFISISNVADGRYIEVNEAFERFTGYRREEVIGKTSLDIGLWHSAEERLAVMQTIASSGEVRDFDLQLCDRSGKVHACLVYASIFESRGERYLIAVVRDVTNDRLAELALRGSEARFSSLFELSPLPTSYSFDTDGYTTYFRNAAFYATFGHDKASSAGRSTTELGLWVNLQDAITARGFRDQSEPVDNWVVQMRHADGRHLWISLYARVIQEPHRKILITTLFDITGQMQSQQKVEELNSSLEARVTQRTEQLQAANAELSQAMRTIEIARDSLVQSEKLASLGALVAGVAHELNTPIGNGLTVASTLEENTRVFALAVKQPMQRSALIQFIGETEMAADLLVRSLSRAAALVSSFKQIAVDQTSAQRRSFELAVLVHEVLLTMGPTTRRAHCTMQTNVDTGVTLDSFPGPLVQVLNNLIENAVLHAFGPEHIACIDIAAQRVDSHHVKITVRDNGRGIAPENIKRIFDPFFTTRMGQGGSGLGLHIVHNIVTGVLGGQINVHSVPGEGTRFVLLLPVTAPHATVAAPALP